MRKNAPSTSVFPRRTQIIVSYYHSEAMRLWPETVRIVQYFCTPCRSRLSCLYVLPHPRRALIDSLWRQRAFCKPSWVIHPARFEDNIPVIYHMSKHAGPRSIYQLVTAYSVDALYLDLMNVMPVFENRTYGCNSITLTTVYLPPQSVS